MRRQTPVSSLPPHGTLDGFRPLSPSMHAASAARARNSHRATRVSLSE